MKYWLLVLAQHFQKYNCYNCVELWDKQVGNIVPFIGGTVLCLMLRKMLSLRVRSRIGERQHVWYFLSHRAKIQLTGSRSQGKSLFPSSLPFDEKAQTASGPDLCCSALRGIAVL